METLDIILVVIIAVLWLAACFEIGVLIHQHNEIMRKIRDIQDRLNRLEYHYEDEVTHNLLPWSEQALRDIRCAEVDISKLMEDTKSINGRVNRIVEKMSENGEYTEIEVRSEHD